MEHETQPRAEFAAAASFEVNCARAAAFASQRRFDHAIAAYRDALAARPLDLGTHLDLGLALPRTNGDAGR